MGRLECHFRLIKNFLRPGSSAVSNQANLNRTGQIVQSNGVFESKQKSDWKCIRLIHGRIGKSTWNCHIYLVREHVAVWINHFHVSAVRRWSSVPRTNFLTIEFDSTAAVLAFLIHSFAAFNSGLIRTGVTTGLCYFSRREQKLHRP